jgi:predicted dehydrogenase
MTPTNQNATPLGVALIGCGGMATHYRANYAHRAVIAYRLVVDVNEEVARQVAADLGVERFSTTWQDALASDIDIVDISTPNHLHAEQATALLGSGKHVILQKPMAPSVEECRQIVAAAKSANRLAGVYISDLEDPLSHDLREIVQSGYLGRISSVRARMAHRGGLTAPPSGNWRGSADKTGGGSFMQLSIHHINLLCWILDDGIASVMGYSKNLYCPNIGGDDTTTAVGEMEGSGALCILDSAWNSDGNSVEIFGTEGHAVIFGGQGAAAEVSLNRPFHGNVIQVRETNRVTRISASGNMTTQCGADNPFNQHLAFVHAVRDGKPAPVDAESGLRDVAVIKAVYLSAEEGRRVFVSELY